MLDVGAEAVACISRLAFEGLGPGIDLPPVAPAAAARSHGFGGDTVVIIPGPVNADCLTTRYGVVLGTGGWQSEEIGARGVVGASAWFLRG